MSGINLSKPDMTTFQQNTSLSVEYNVAVKR